MKKHRQGTEPEEVLFLIDVLYTNKCMSIVNFVQLFEKFYHRKLLKN